MPVTINVNRLSLVHEASGGVSTATLPNVCATPDVGLVAYPSTAYSRDLAGGTRDVVADGGSSIAVRGSTFAVSSGDEPGTLGGVVSRVNGAESRFLSWSLDVKIEGRNACRLTDKMLHNHGNTLNCSGVIQAALRASGAEVDVLAKDRAHHGKYSLEVTVKRAVVTQPPTPAGKPPPPPVTTLVPLDEVRVRITAASDAATTQGQTFTRPGKTPTGKCLFDHLAKGKYGVALYHDCFAEDPRNPKVESVRADPTRDAAKMGFTHLRTIANKRGVVLGVRSDAALVVQVDAGNQPVLDANGKYILIDPSGPAPENVTTTEEFNDLVLGSFLSSRCGDSAANRALDDLSGPHIGSLDVSYQYVEPTMELAAHKGMQLMVTPLVWPAPLVTPGWPAGHPETHKGQPGFIDWPQSYVAKRLAKQGKADTHAHRQETAMEVHEAFIRRVVAEFKGRKVARAGGIAATSPAPSYVVVNECLNMRYHGAQENATPDRDFARDHPLFRLLGVWDVDETRENLGSNIDDSFKDAIVDKSLWKHILRSFRVAHEADPEALLILNDYGIEGIPQSFDYWGTKRKRDDTDAALKKDRDHAISGPSKPTKAKPWKSAKTHQADAHKAATGARKKVYAAALPAVVDASTHTYRDAAEAADIKYDNDRDALGQKFVQAMQGAEDASRGISAAEKKVYKPTRAALEAFYRAAVIQLEEGHAKAVAAAETVFSGAYTAAPGGVAPAPAAENHALILADVQKRHAAAQAYHRAVHGADRVYYRAYHAAWVLYQKRYKSHVKPHADAYDRAEKPQLFYRLVKWLLARSGTWKSKLVIGFQMHYPASPATKGYLPEDIARNIRRYAELKLPIVITELDVSHEAISPDSKVGGLMQLSDAAGKPAIDALKSGFKAVAGETPQQASDREYNQNRQVAALTNQLADAYVTKNIARFLPVFRDQAERTRELIKACLSARSCLGITTWNNADFRSAFRYCGYWFRPSFQCSIPGCAATHPPGEYDRKPCYHAAASAFLASKKQFTEAQIRGGSAIRYLKTLDRSTKKPRKK